MSERPSIAVACGTSHERSSITEWLSLAGYQPVPIPDLMGLDQHLNGKHVEALIADLGLSPREDGARDVMRRLGSNRPLIVIGDTSALPASLRNELSVIPRPVTREALVLGVGLALAEGRPVRRFPRKAVEPIRATAHGMAVIIREASPGGVGLDMPGARPSPLPPYFRLRVPEFGVHVVVRRAWVAPGAQMVRCGGTVEGDLPDAACTWVDFAKDAPAPVSAGTRRCALQSS
jgi:hypothetical protein